MVATAEVRNVGQAGLPAGVPVGVFAGDTQIATATTSYALLPGQTADLTLALPPTFDASVSAYAKTHLDPAHPLFHECREDNDQSALAMASCAVR